MQLGKLRTEVGRIKNLGAEVFAISHDSQEDARRMASELGLDFPVLSDPSMRVIIPYGMKGEAMPMADMGYVLIDATGHIRVRRIDRQFGEHAEELVRDLSRLSATNADAK